MRYNPEKERFKRQQRRRAERQDSVKRFNEQRPTTRPKGNEDLFSELKKLKGGEKE
jgi:hypothetical protein